MKFLNSPKQIEAALEALIKKCDRLRWAVAWASRGSPLFKNLKANEGKIGQLTVGIHFYQTDPDFIESFLAHKQVSFVMNPDGVFHPKLYFFELDGGDWECVVGSPNFTHGGLTSNNEVAVQFGSSDQAAAESRSEIEATLAGFESLGRRLTISDLAAYRSVWTRQQSRLGPLSGNYQSKASKGKAAAKSPLDVPLFVANWNSYFKLVRLDEHHTIEGRLAVLEEANRLFTSHTHFSEIDQESRKGIAGFKKTEKLDWLWFGSMKGAGYFKQAVLQNNNDISDALDEIPLYGAVGRDDFNRFVERFRGAFKNAGMATGTRLLSFKRPDYFVCFDSKNKSKLCEAFETPQNVTLDDYWDRVVARVADTNWWNSPPPSDPLQKRIWNCRVAFLDVLFYEA